MFSKELSEIDRNTVRYMIEEQQEQIDEQKEQIDEKNNTIDEQQKRIKQLEIMLAKRDIDIPK